MAEIKQIKTVQATERSDKQAGPGVFGLRVSGEFSRRKSSGSFVAHELQAKVEVEERQLEHITQLLGTLGSSRSENSVTQPKVPRKPSPEHEAFPLCRGQPLGPLGEVQLSATHKSNRSHTSKCSPDTHVRLFAPQADNNEHPFEFGCCPVHEEYCAGCEAMDATGAAGACKTCSGGFTRLTAGTCVACMDFPHWVDNTSKNCYEASCSDEAWARSFSKSVGEMGVPAFVFWNVPILGIMIGEA